MDKFITWYTTISRNRMDDQRNVFYFLEMDRNNFLLHFITIILQTARLKAVTGEEKA